MTRFLILITMLGVLSACEQYREPQANCFNFASRGTSSPDCIFMTLSESDPLDEDDE